MDFGPEHCLGRAEDPPEAAATTAAASVLGD